MAFPMVLVKREFKRAADTLTYVSDDVPNSEEKIVARVKQFVAEVNRNFKYIVHLSLVLLECFNLKFTSLH